jgi:protein-L-isoaspartate(D-aspartate) O-methyltransferase
MPRSLPPDHPDPALEAAKARAHRADLAEEEAEAKAAFHLRMRARGIRDLQVLRAFELVPRQRFVPHRYLDLASRDLALPIGCGQTLNEPWLVARMIEALRIEQGHRVLEIGAGSGYATAILAHLAEEVIGLERFQSLAIAAQARLEEIGIMNAAVVWGDGLDVPEAVGTFDRILVHGLLDRGLDVLTGRLSEGGALVCAMSSGDGQAIVRIAKADAPTATICPCRLQPIVPGTASAL